MLFRYFDCRIDAITEKLWQQQKPPKLLMNLWNVVCAHDMSGCSMYSVQCVFCVTVNISFPSCLSSVYFHLFRVCCIDVISGVSHNIMKIGVLLSKLTDVVNEKKVWIYDKEEHLLGISKQLTAIISDWDTETQQMIEKLHKARDEQVIAFIKRD